MVGERVPTAVDIASAGRVIFNPDMDSSVFSSEIVAHRRGKWLIGLFLNVWLIDRLGQGPGLGNLGVCKRFNSVTHIELRNLERLRLSCRKCLTR